MNVEEKMIMKDQELLYSRYLSNGCLVSITMPESLITMTPVMTLYVNLIQHAYA